MKVRDKLTRIITLNEEEIQLFSELAEKIINNTNKVGLSSRVHLTEREKEYLKSFIINYEYSKEIDPSEGSGDTGNDCEVTTL